MRVLPLLTAFLVGSSAFVLPVERSVGRRDALDNELVTRGRGKGGDDSESSDPEGHGITPEPDEAEQANAKALKGNEEDVFKANKDLGPETTSEDKPIELDEPLKLDKNDKNSRTDQNAIYLQKENGKVTKIIAYLGAPEHDGGGGHSAHLDFYLELNGGDWTNPPVQRRASDDDKKIHRNVLKLINTDEDGNEIEHNGEDVYDEKQWASLADIEGYARTVFRLPKRESIGYESKLAGAVRRALDKYGDIDVQVIPNGKPKGDQPLGEYLLGPRAVDYYGQHLSPRVFHDTSQGNWKMPKNSNSIKEYTGPDKRSTMTVRELFFDVVDQHLAKRQTGGLTGGMGPNTDMTAQYKQDLSDAQGYRTDTQNQIAKLIWPTLVNLTAGTNTAEYYLMALSIFVDLTEAPLVVGGPFWLGMNSYSNSKPSSPLQAAAQARLIEDYETAWANASGLVAKAGLDTNLEMFSNYTDVVNTTLLPPTPNDWNKTADNMFTPFIPNVNASTKSSKWQALNQTFASRLNLTSGNGPVPPFLNSTGD